MSVVLLKGHYDVCGRATQQEKAFSHLAFSLLGLIWGIFIMARHEWKLQN